MSGHSAATSEHVDGLRVVLAPRWLSLVAWLPMLWLCSDWMPAAAAAGSAPGNGTVASPSLIQIRERTSIPWQCVSNRITGDQVLPGEFLRPYPESPAQESAGGANASAPIGAEAAQSRALAFIQANAALLVGEPAAGALAGANLTVREVITNRNSAEYAARGEDYTVVLDQYVGGVHVFDTEARVSMTGSGEIWAVSNGLAAVGAVPTAPTLDAVAALAHIRALLNDPAAESEDGVELIVYPPSKLAWRANVLKPHFEELLVDATDGQVLLRRRNVHDACTVTLDVKDKDGLPLSGATGEYYTGTTLGWSKLLNANGQATDTNSPVGSGFCRVRIEGDRVRVRDADSNSGATVVQDTPVFTTDHDQLYSQGIALNVSSGINSSEGGVAFREVMRAWDYVHTQYGFDRALVTFYVDDDTGPSCGGNWLYFPHGRAVMDNGPPSAAAPCDDTMLHEYGHAVQYGAYGGWGRPSGCKCANHGGTANDCSFDALLEGWAEYFPVMIYHHLNSSDVSYDWSNSGSGRSIESNANTDTEERDEWTFAGALWDIYDSVADSGDTLALGDDEIWTVMRNDKPKTVEEFYQKFISRYPQYAAGVEQIYSAHAMHPAWLTLNTTQLDFGPLQTELSFTIRRVGWYGDGVIVKPDWAITSDASWITAISEPAGSTTTETDTITVNISRSGMTVGAHTATLTIAPQYYGRPQTITVLCQVGTRPNQPAAVAPHSGAVAVSLTPVLSAAAFTEPNPGDIHAASQWQVDDNSDFSSPEFDSQETATDKTQITVPAGALTYKGVYYWRVRYKSSSDLWSEWSTPASFTCTCNGVGPDLDGDCDVDSLDLARFRACLSGEGMPYVNPDCVNADADADGDVDQADFGIFQRCLSGSYVPADPDCAQ